MYSRGRSVVGNRSFGRLASRSSRFYAESLRPRRVLRTGKTSYVACKKILRRVTSPATGLAYEKEVLRRV